MCTANASTAGGEPLVGGRRQKVPGDEQKVFQAVHVRPGFEQDGGMKDVAVVVDRPADRPADRPV